MRRKRLSDRTGAGLDPCAAIQARIDLAPGQSREIVFVFGAARDADEARHCIQRFGGRAGARQALEAMALMQQGRIIALDATLAMNAARLSLDLKLPMADSIVLATARAHNAVLWTQDDDFEGLDGVKYVAKKKGGKGATSPAARARTPMRRPFQSLQGDVMEAQALGPDHGPSGCGYWGCLVPVFSFWWWTLSLNDF